MNIVVIDDHRANIELVKKMLSINGYKNVIAFLDAKEALNYLGLDENGNMCCSSPNVDIILTDINMPNMNGIEFCKVIKQHANLKNVPILMLTAFDNEQLLQEAFEAGAFDYIRKPFTMSELIVRIQFAIKQKQMIDELTQTSKVLEENHQLYKSLFNNNSDACFLLDLNGQFLEVNEAAVNIIGHSRQEFANMNIQRLIDPIDLPQIIEIFGKVKQGEAVNFEGKFYLKNGSIGEFSNTVVPVMVKGDIAGVIVIAKNITEQKEMQRRLEADLSLAKSLQEGVLSAPIQQREISIIGKYLPSMRLSGDMYCWYQIDDHRYSVILLDVMGHGVASSLVCMSVRSLLPGLLMRVTDPVRVMKELNRHIFRLFKGKMYYFTAIYLVIDIKERTIEYFNAGHPPGVVIDGEEKITELTDGSIPIGIVKRMDYKKGKLTFHGFTQIFLYTDGLLDVFGKNLQKCHETLKQFYREYRLQENKHMVEAIQQKITLSRQEDDISFISIRIHP